jgi:hypothetical protein
MVRMKVDGMTGNLETGKRKRGRPRKIVADTIGSKSASSSNTNLQKPPSSDDDQSVTINPDTDDGVCGAALDYADPPEREHRRRYQFVMDENVRHLIGVRAHRANVPASYLVNELVKKYCRDEIAISIDPDTAADWLEYVDGPEMPKERV